MPVIQKVVAEARAGCEDLAAAEPLVKARGTVGYENP
jgi:hypothetical protein